jgi:hypothetical protein
LPLSAGSSVIRPLFDHEHFARNAPQNLPRRTTRQVGQETVLFMLRHDDQVDMLLALFIANRRGRAAGFNVS